MAHLKKVIVFSLALLVTATLQACGPNEDVDECPTDCAYDNCPKNELQDKIKCSKPSPCPPAGCKCSFNFRKADNGTCIPTTDCPPFECKENEVYDSCPPYCPSDDCSDGYRGCPFFILILRYCSPACRCKEGYLRNNGVCVPFHECPNINITTTESYTDITGTTANTGSTADTQETTTLKTEQTTCKQ